MIRIVVYGLPGPQGSKSFKGFRGGKAIMTESSKKVAPWRQDVKFAAERVRDGRPPLDGPLIARMVFTLPKPKSAPKTRRTFPDRTPDLSKLLRSTEDALTDAGIWADDARVIGYSRAAKVFPGEDPEALEVPGVVIALVTEAESRALAWEEYIAQWLPGRKDGVNLDFVQEYRQTMGKQ